MKVLGFHGGVSLRQHEPGAALIIDGRVVAACEEERYLRIKSAYGHLPYHSLKACLDIAGISLDEIDLLVMPGVDNEALGAAVGDYLRHNFGCVPKMMRIHHQKAHLAAAFYGSGFEESLCLSLDATGDGACGMLAHATKEKGIEVLEEIPTENSIGYFYTLMTYYLGFSDGDEYKVMGLAPYGEPSVDLTKIIQPTNSGWTFDWSFVRDDPPARSPFEPLYSPQVEALLGQPNRQPGGPMTDFYKNVARSTQAMTEECISSLVSYLQSKHPECRNLAYAGGVALNCKVNRELFYSQNLDHIYVSPVASDRGLALGCAYYGAVELGDRPWPLVNVYMGSSYSNDVIRNELTSNSVSFDETDDPTAAAAELLAEDKIIGWHQGRSEAGARALGARSILASCTDPAMKDKVNARIKYREEYRPFAPAVMAEHTDDYFKANGTDFPYMSFTLDARESKADSIQAVVHIDNTARIQTVRSSDNELYYQTIKNYRDRTDVPVILNTSFNLKGQPIVETPRDALMTFFGCGLDALVMGNFVVRK